MKENNKLGADDLENEKKKKMGNGRRRKLTRKQEKAMFAKKPCESRRSRRIYTRCSDFDDDPFYNPNKSFPKKLKIYVPDSSPTLRMRDIDSALDSIFDKKKKKG